MDECECTTHHSFTDHTPANPGLTLSVRAEKPPQNGYTYIYDVNGTTINAGTYGPGTGPPFETDTNNNSITTAFNGSYDTVWTDTLGLTALTSHNAGSNSYGYYKWTDINGGAQQITESFTPSSTIKTAFGCPNVSDTNAPGYYLLSSINYPDGGAISLGYETISGGYYTGRVGSITLRTGGTITYGYSGGNSGIDCAYGVPPILTRTTTEGATTYTWALVNNSNGNYGNTTTVIDPGGNRTVYTFTGLTSTGNAAPPVTQVLTQVKHYQASSTLLTTDDYCYQGLSGQPANCLAAVVSLPITEVDVYHTINGMSSSSRTQTKYDKYGNATLVAQYDFGSSSVTRQVATTYGSCSASCTGATPTISAVGSNVNDKPGRVV